MTELRTASFYTLGGKNHPPFSLGCGQSQAEGDQLYECGLSINHQKNVSLSKSVFKYHKNRNQA